MKLRYLLPFLSLLLPKDSEAQTKIEGNKNTLDVKTPYFDASLRDTFGLENLVNIQGDVKLKFRKNSLYAERDGILDYTYGGHLDIGPFEGYGNFSDDDIKTENTQTEETRIGIIDTETSILNDKISEDFGIFLNYNGFFVGYESATENNDIEGNTIIRNGERQNRVPFSLNYDNESTIYNVGFRDSFLKIIKNRERENEFDKFLMNLGHTFEIGERELNLEGYYGDGFSGFMDADLFENLTVNLNYDYENGFGFALSSSDYSDLNRRDFERNLENRLRIVDRIYDSPLETKRDYLQDMFFTGPFSYNFSIDKDEITANINLKYVMGHYSEESIKAGVRLGPLIGAYDFESEDFTFGLFFD